MLKQLKDYKLGKKQQGFTIIEVMIVLAIAALILVIVFLAVPALQRSSRNNSRDTDASNVLAAVNTYESNNNGQIPSACSDTGDAIGTNCDFLDGIKIGYYNTSDSKIAVEEYSDGLSLGANDKAKTNSLFIVTGAKCDGSDLEEGQSTRQFVAWYGTETGGGVQAKCTAG